jgi:dihydrofolate reductase
MSLDGYIARENNTVDWLDAYQSEEPSPYNYTTYYATVSALIFGRKTFEVLQKLAPQYPYPKKPAFLFTSNPSYTNIPPISEITIIGNNVTQSIQEIKKKYESRIWLLGGGEFATFCLKEHLLDEIIISVMPITLGQGIRWINSSDIELKWSLTDFLSLKNGCVQLAYKIKN